MLDIIILYFICKKMGRIAAAKGLKPLNWKLFTIFTWILFEVIGFLIAVNLFGFRKDNAIAVMLFVVAFAFGGYLIVEFTLDRMPDQKKDGFGGSM